MTGDDLAQTINEGEQDPELQVTLSQLIAFLTQYTWQNMSM